MHRTTFLSTLALAALTTRTTAQGIDNEDIAPQCAAQCSNIATVTDSCERQFDDVQNEDQQQLDCICSAQNMATEIPECEACQRQYYAQDDDYDDIQTLLRRCGFSSVSTTGMGTMTSMGAAPTTVITSVYTTTDTDTDDDDGDTDTDIDVETTVYTSTLPTSAAASATGAASNALTSATGGAGGAASSGIDAVDSAANSGTAAVGTATDAAGSAVEQSGNRAPMVTAAPVLAAAGIAAAVLGS